MQHSAIVSRLDLLRGFISYLQQNFYLQQNHPTFPYKISVIRSSLRQTHNYTNQTTLGSALWAVHLQLYSMIIGIARINWQQIMHAGLDLWLPVTSGRGINIYNESTPAVPRQVFSNFYAMPFVADFIGVTGDTTQAAQLETGVDKVAAYAAYVDGELRRIAIVNLNIWDRENGTRPSTKLSIFLPAAVTHVNIAVLESPEGTHAGGHGITYAGSQRTSASEGLEVKGYTQ